MTAAVPRDAATVVVVRDANGRLEVLLLQRAERGDHNSGAWVFPGGLLDPGDREAVPDGPFDDAQASARLGVERGGLAFYLAALRECFEESGILLATDASDEVPAVDEATRAKLWPARDAVKEGHRNFADVCREFGLRPAPEKLHYIAHWLTPMGRAKRFDTRFFLAIAPAGQSAMHDAQETLDHVWLSPAEALSPANARRLMTPTRSTIELLLPFADTRALAQWAAGPREVRRILPRLAVDASGVRPVLPGEPAFAEIEKLDPEGKGGVWCELRTDVPVALSDHVLRVSTGAGRHSYVIGDDGACIVLDPASSDSAHLQALASAAPGGIQRILLTRMDEGLRATAERLRERTGARLDDPVTLATCGGIGADNSSLLLRPVGGEFQCVFIKDRIAFAKDVASLVPELRGAADYVAGPQGFLQPVAKGS